MENSAVEARYRAYNTRETSYFILIVRPER